MKVVSCHSQHNNFYIVIGIFGRGFILCCFIIIIILFFPLLFWCAVGRRLGELLNINRVHAKVHFPTDLSLTQKYQTGSTRTTMGGKCDAKFKYRTNVFCVMCVESCGTSNQFAVSLFLTLFFYFTRNGFIFFCWFPPFLLGQFVLSFFI